MARTRPKDIKFLEELFTPREGKVWFIEKIKTNEWITGSDLSLTKDPNKALCFKTQMQALTYCNLAKLNPDEYTQTEHEFI